MENKCKIVQDLLPTYIENLTSDETAIFIKEHIDSCEDCKKVYEDMKEDIENKNIEDTEIINEIKKYKTRVTLIKSIFILIILLIVFSIIGTISYRFYVVKKAYVRNTNYKEFESFTIEEYDDSVEHYEKHYTTYYKDDIMKKYYGDDVIEYYDGEKHYFFDNDNMTYWIKDEDVNTTLNINISVIDGMENIIKDNGKVSNFEILKFVIFTKDLTINTRGFRDKKYYQLACGAEFIYLDTDTFFAERVQDQKEKYVYEETKEYRVRTANVGWREIQEPDFSKYTLIGK